MSDFFDDNENVADKEQSTVFSTPSEHTDKKEIKKKKLLPKIIAGVLCVAILAGGTFAIVKLIPKKEEDISSGELEQIEVLNIDSKDISAVSVKNSNGTYKIYGEKKDEDKAWYVDGIDKNLIDTSKASSVVSSVADIKASREITEKSDEECGFNNAEVIAEISKTDDTVLSVVFGSTSPDGTGCYLKLSNSDKKYLVDSSIKDTLQFDSLYFASSSNIPAFAKFDGADSYFENDSLSKFDTLTLTGNNFPKPLIIVPNDTGDTLSQYMSYKITSPQNRYADNVDTLITMFQNGVAVSGAYSYDVGNKSVASFGLDNPDITLSMKIMSKELTFKFKLQSDGDYAAWCNEGNLIYRVSKSTVEEVANSTAKSYYSTLICLYSIDDLSSLTINGHTFSIKPVEEKEDADIEDKYIITYNGKKIDCSSFQNLYQYIVSLSCFDFTTENAAKNDTVNLDFSFSSGEKINIAFDKTSETKYQYSVNGEPMGKVSSSSLKKLLKYTEKLINGEKIGEIK